VPYHVEIRRSFQRARAFNLGEAELRAGVLDPWRSGRTVVLGDQRWEPGESRLTVLEGPRLDAPELAHGRGWQRAERASRDVTLELLETSPAVALVAESQAAGDAVAAALDGFALVAWEPVRRRILAGEAPGVAGAVLVAAAEPSAAWLLDAGLAAGALGRRAVVVGPAPAALRELAAGPGELAARLRG
jgi:hypothetical protein